MRRLEKWARQHPWQFAAAVALWLFVFLAAFGALMFDRSFAEDVAFAAAYAIVFSILSGAAWSYRRRKDDAR